MVLGEGAAGGEAGRVGFNPPPPPPAEPRPPRGGAALPEALLLGRLQGAGGLAAHGDGHEAAELGLGRRGGGDGERRRAGRQRPRQ